eukprot:7183543-Alexandrium_andersonii.AAC.1
MPSGPILPLYLARGWHVLDAATCPAGQSCKRQRAEKHGCRHAQREHADQGAAVRVRHVGRE